jgi:hypothetical protein
MPSCRSSPTQDRKADHNHHNNAQALRPFTRQSAATPFTTLTNLLSLGLLGLLESLPHLHVPPALSQLLLHPENNATITWCHNICVADVSEAAYLTRLSLSSCLVLALLTLDCLFSNLCISSSCQQVIFY